MEVLTRRLRHSLLLPAWLAFRLRNRDHGAWRPFADPEVGTTDEGIQGFLGVHERHLRELLTARPGLRFLEIGIGPTPNIDRLRLLLANGVRYTGVDFTSVCESHALQMRREGISSDAVEFIHNATGTYAWTLFDMLGEGRRFDVIYLDGHHTFYVDLPAVLLGDRLLVPSGLFLVDDIRWTLDFLQANLRRHFSAWRFYHSMYDFSAYTKEQRSLPHVGLMIQRLLVAELGYGVDRAHSTPYWWTLRKPPHDLPPGVPVELAVGQ